MFGHEILRPEGPILPLRATFAVRVIAGHAKGCKLAVAPHNGTRPTPMRAREALFSIWQSRGVCGRGLDLFAGSGAVGIEALSRGHPGVCFAERDPAALAALRANLAKLPAHLQARARLMAMPSEHALSHLQQEAAPFDWIYVDPPFATGDYAALFARLATPSLRHAQTWLVAEHDGRAGAPTSPQWQARETRRFGAVSLSFYGPTIAPAPQA